MRVRSSKGWLCQGMMFHQPEWNTKCHHQGLEMTSIQVVQTSLTNNNPLQNNKGTTGNSLIPLI